jgi:hypothetical protein
MNLQESYILRAGLTWGLVAVVLAIIGGVLAPLVPNVEGLSLGTYVLLMAGVHYAVRVRQGILGSAIGGALSGVLAAVLLTLVRLSSIVNMPLSTGNSANLVAALVAGFLAGLAGGLGYEIIDR